MRSRHLRSGAVAAAFCALVALPVAARDREGAGGGRGEGDGLERRERGEIERRERRERRRQEMMERRARRTEPGTPFARPGGPGREPPPTMALSGDNFYVVTGRTIRQFDAKTLKEKNSAELPLPDAIVERQTKMKERFIKRFDKDRDGFITEDELPRPEMLRRLDRDGDGKVSVSEAPAPAAMTGPPGPTTLLIEKGSVYVYQGGYLYRFDAEDLALQAKVELVKPRGSGMRGGRGDRQRLREKRSKDKRKKDKRKKDKRNRPAPLEVPDDPVRF